jgi:signal transduction histidine kinase
MNEVDPALEPAKPTSSECLNSAHLIHDLRSALTVMSSCVDGLRTRMEGSPNDRDLSDLIAALAEAGRVTGEILGASRTLAIDRPAIDLNDVVREDEPTLSRLTVPGVTLAIRVAPTPVLTFAHRAEIERILTNLVANAVEAMEDDGTVTIEVGELHLAGPGPGDVRMRVHSHVRLTVADTGAGIDAAVLPRVFEPFFSTKDNRSGFGLARVASTTRALGGWILVESQSGSGTRIHVCLPAIEA